MEYVSQALDGVLAPLRPHLKPFSQTLPAPLRDALHGQLGAKCYRVLVLELGTDPACLKLGLSKALGIGIIAMSAVVKMPQLVKILEARSGEGLSLTAVVLETVSFVVTAAYNVRSGNPFSTYGEAALIGAQNVAIGAAMLAFSGKPAPAGIWMGSVTMLGMMLAREEGGLRYDTVQVAMTGASVMGVLSKVPQIWQNYQQGGTGQLSAFAVFAFLFGSGSRIYTTLQEVEDPIILAGFAAGFALNLILALQMLYYWNAPAVNAKVRQIAEPVKAKAKELKEQAETTGVAQKSKAPSTRRRG